MAHKFNYLLELYDLYYGEAASNTRHDIVCVVSLYFKIVSLIKSWKTVYCVCSKERNSGVRSQSTPPQHLESKDTSRSVSCV